MSEETQLDRIERKLDEILGARLRFTTKSSPTIREWTEEDRKRSNQLFLLPETEGDAPKPIPWRRRLLRGAAGSAWGLGVALMALGLLALAQQHGIMP